MTGENTSRFIIYIGILLPIAYDIFAAVRSWKTISAEVRQLNHDSGWLIAIGWAGLWLHFFGKAFFDYIR